MLPRQRGIDKRQVNPDGTLPFYLGMKSHFAMLLVLGSLAAQAAPQPQDAPGRPAPEPVRVPELREVLQQYHPDSAAAPLHLTAQQRAELRRQLTEFGPPPWATEAAAPNQRKDP